MEATTHTCAPAGRLASRTLARGTNTTDTYNTAGGLAGVKGIEPWPAKKD